MWNLFKGPDQFGELKTQTSKNGYPSKLGLLSIAVLSYLLVEEDDLHTKNVGTFNYHGETVFGNAVYFFIKNRVLIAKNELSSLS